MPHDHRDPEIAGPDAGDRRLSWAVGVNVGLTVAQVVGGVLSGSLALIADALHNFSDAVALIIAFAARRIARRPADAVMNFGYGRAEAVAALVNYTTLVVIALYLIYEGIVRFFQPEPIDGWMVVWIAGIALVVDVATAMLTWQMSKGSMNIRAAFLHNVADALGSVAVIVAGTLVILFDWVWVDPAVTLMVAGYILWHVRAEVGGVVRLLMMGSPVQIGAEAVIRAIESDPDVASVHNLRLWEMREREPALDAHVVIAAQSWEQAERVKARIKAMLGREFGISHSTLELERSSEFCLTPERIGGG